MKNEVFHIAKYTVLEKEEEGLKIKKLSASDV